MWYIDKWKNASAMAYPQTFGAVGPMSEFIVIYTTMTVVKYVYLHTHTHIYMNIK